MSQENVELARRFYPGRVDLAAIFADASALEALKTAFEPWVHPEFQTVIDPRYQMLLGEPGEPAAGSSLQVAAFSGIDGFVSTFGEWVGGWERWVVTPTDFIDVDESRVLVALEISSRSKTQQVNITAQGANLLTFENGRLTQLELFLSRAEAFRASGLSE